ncbi:MAG: ABC transporter permease, partial [Bacteroidetes bacterium]|nr:ABC transporter permease [Bacteroidota bacterium]
MLKNYFKTALRTLARNKVFSLINVAGLSIGISSAMVIYLIVSYDFSFDKFEKGRDRIFRVVSDFKFSGEDFHNSGITYPLGKALQKEATGIENITHFYTNGDDIKVSVPDAAKKDPAVFKKQDNIVFADNNYFDLVSYNWLAGSKTTALQRAYETVLTESNAKIYFPKLKPSEIIGKEIIFNDTIRTNVAGIVKDLDKNSDFVFKTFVSLATLENRLLDPGERDEWGNTNSASQLLIRVAPGVAPQKITKLANALHEKYKKPDPEDHSTTAYSLQPFDDIHFNTTYNSFGSRTAHLPTLYGLLAVAAFLLLLGCINFINLT